MWHVTAAKYGKLSGSKGGFYYRYSDYGEPDAPQELAFYFWVIRDDSRTLLFDTGFDPLVGQRRGRTVLEDPLKLLQSLDVRTDSVDAVIISHCHYDHVGNLGLFGNSELYVPARELQFWLSAHSRSPQFAEHIEPADLEQLAQARRDGRIKLYDDGDTLAPGIRAIALPGHTPGQCGLYVESAPQALLLTSDAVHLYEELDRNRPFKLFTDLAEMHRSYERVRTLCTESGADFVPGHDPALAERYKPLDRGRLMYELA